MSNEKKILKLIGIYIVFIFILILNIDVAYGFEINTNKDFYDNYMAKAKNNSHYVNLKNMKDFKNLQQKMQQLITENQNKNGKDEHLSKYILLDTELVGITYLKFNFSFNEYLRMFRRYRSYKNREIYDVVQKNMEYVLYNNYISSLINGNLYSYFKLKQLIRNGFIYEDKFISVVNNINVSKYINYNFYKEKKKQQNNFRLVLGLK